MTLIPVIARSKATWQSTPTPSLRGAQRRGNPYFKQCRTLDGLLRLWLAMTVGTRNDPNSCHCEEQSDVAIHTHPVIARSAATWQSIPTPSLRGAQRRGNPYFRQCRTLDGLLRLRLAMTVGTRNDPNSCHCEEQSDVAIHTHPVIARSKATWQSIFQAVPDARWIASPSARNDGGAARNDGGVLAVILIPVIARSVATWQSIFQAVPDARWIASLSARNDGGVARNDGGDSQ